MLFGFIQTNELHAAAGAIDGDVDSAAERAVDGAVDGAVAGYADRIRRLRKSTIIQHLRTRRIGLVLPGCGAKGAFQAGALKVLHDLGIREFAAISGTSAGSLNGVAVAAAKTDAMVAEWWSMRFGKVINWQYSTIPTALMILIGSTFCFRYRKSALIAYLLTLALIMGLMPAGLLKIGLMLERFSISSSIALRRTISAFLGSGPFDLACPTYLTTRTSNDRTASQARGCPAWFAMDPALCRCSMRRPTVDHRDSNEKFEHSAGFQAPQDGWRRGGLSPVSGNTSWSLIAGWSGFRFQARFTALRRCNDQRVSGKRALRSRMPQPTNADLDAAVAA